MSTADSRTMRRGGVSAAAKRVSVGVEGIRLAHSRWGRVLPGKRVFGFVWIVPVVSFGRFRAEKLDERYYARTVNLSARRTDEDWLETEGVARIFETVFHRKEMVLG